MTTEATAAPPPESSRPVSRPVRPLFPLWGWLGVWIVAGLVVLTTLVAFLLGIVGDLESIDGSLAEASNAVGGAGGHVKPLPSYIADVNTTLTAIDGALKPVPGATHDISGSLVDAGCSRDVAAIGWMPARSSMSAIVLPCLSQTEARSA